MVEFAAKYPWLIPAMPLFAALFIGLFGKKLKGAAAIPAILAMLVSATLALALLFGISNETIRPIKDLMVFHWFSAGTFNVNVGITVDYLTAIYLSFITVIGTLIFIYASNYMKGDYGYWRFFAYLSIFVFFMCVLVMGNNLIMLYLGWEGVGLASYLLIGYYYPRPSAVAAAKKAFITNRVGDFGLAIGIFIIYLVTGQVEYTKIFDFLQGSLNADTVKAWQTAIYILPFCLMLGAFGKSAQFPLHVWLPDAMEGPTPVSALIHAATMVTAGIYLIARMMPVFHTDALFVVACVGGFTAFLAATIACCQYDLKKIWAYSTLSQLGYMFLGLGVFAADSAVFHVFTHAWFKALLFLSAGSVMHAMGGELDIRKMSGVRKVMPITMFTMLIGCLALAGVPGLAGFFSKDEIIYAAFKYPGPWGAVFGIAALVVALMTAYYTFRLFFRVFMGPTELPATAGGHEPSPFALADDHGHGHDDHHAHDAHGHTQHSALSPQHSRLDGSPVLWLPLLILCIGAVGAGYLGLFGGHHEAGHEAHGGWFHHFLGGTLGTLHPPEGAPMIKVGHGAMMIISGIIAVIGISLAAYFHWINRHATEILAANLKGLVAFLYNKWYFDEIYNALIIKPLWVLGHIFFVIDRFVVDGAVFVVGFLPQLAGYSLKPTQRGLLQRYAVGMVAGVAAVIVGVLWLIRS